jgi:hypothetical protein
VKNYQNCAAGIHIVAPAKAGDQRLLIEFSHIANQRHGALAIARAMQKKQYLRRSFE